MAVVRPRHLSVFGDTVSESIQNKIKDLEMARRLNNQYANEQDARVLELYMSPKRKLS